MLYGLEKEVDSGSLPHSINQSNPFQPSSSKFKSKLVITFFSLFSLILISFNPISIPFPVPISLATFSHKCSHSISNDLKHESSSTCPQVQELNLKPLPDLIQPSSNELAQLLSGAVQVDTSVGDNSPTVNADPEFWAAIFSPFSDYLAKAFPKIHSQDSPIQLTKVNNHGLLYTWKGSADENQVKPLLFMAHQDVVPVEPSTFDGWTHPPFSGFFDEENQVIWGRGASDTKMSLISILSSLESLLSSSFSPRRTIIASFGFDEESAGTEGGEALSAYLQTKYGANSISMIVDEGESLVGRNLPSSEGGIGLSFASPAIAEKGYLDVKLLVETPGGHSSNPPKHTGIGYLSLLIAELERNPHEYHLGLDSPSLGFLQCTREAPGIDGGLKKALIKMEILQLKFKGKKLNHRQVMKLEKVKKEILDKLDDEKKLAFATSQAVDLISGGVKINALPELSYAVINHRLDITQSVQDLRTRISKVLLPLTKELNLSLNAWNQSTLSNNLGSSSKGTVVLEDAFNSALEPAPFTPLLSEEDETKLAKPWELLSGVIKRTWKEEDVETGEMKSILVAPTLMEGNTDTKSYWALSRHIYRFSPSTLKKSPIPGGSNIHTVNENEQVDSLIQAWNFFTSLIRGADLADL